MHSRVARFRFGDTISSFTDLTGIEGCTTKMFGVEARSVTGAKSFTRSYESLL